MAGLAQAPVLQKTIPSQVVNEGGTYGPFDLKQFIQSPTPESGEVRFFAELSGGASLPRGIACTTDGILSGIPAKGTQGDYEIVLIVENDSGIPLTAQFNFSIKSSLVVEGKDKGAEWWTDLKAKVWDALGKDLTSIPDLQAIYERPVSEVEIYYLLQRFATLTVWDAYNLDPPGEKVLLTLADASPHYNVYHCGSCLIGSPKDLFSYQRTIQDALQTARAMAGEVYKLGWTVQLAGFEKMSRVFWIEAQHLGDKYQKYIEILHYLPSSEDIRLCSKEANMTRLLSG